MKTDKFTLFVYFNFLVLLSTPLYSRNINKQIVNIADKILTDYSFLNRYHYTKSKNYLKRRYRARHWIPMFIGTSCISIKRTWWACNKYIISWTRLGHLHFNQNCHLYDFFLVGLVVTRNRLHLEICKLQGNSRKSFYQKSNQNHFKFLISSRLSINLKARRSWI